MGEFIKLEPGTVKYFDILVEYLIMPMMIRYLKNFNFFKYFNISINKDNNIKINTNNNNNNNNDDERSSKDNNSSINAKDEPEYDEEFLLNVLETLTFKLNKTIFDVEKKEEMKYKLLTLLIVIFFEYINKKNNNINYNEKTTKIYYTIQTLLSNSSFTKNKEALGLWRIYLLLDICLFEKQEKIEKNIKDIYNFYKNLNDDYN